MDSSMVYCLYAQATHCEIFNQDPVTSRKGLLKSELSPLGEKIAELFTSALVMDVRI